MEVEQLVARLEERLDGVREDIQELRRVSADNRKRLDGFEGDRQAVKTMAETIAAMPGRMRGLAQEAATEALVQAERKHRGLLSWRVQVAGLSIAFVVCVCTVTSTAILVLR